jgi:enoyl-CoA hydratase
MATKHLDIMEQRRFETLSFYRDAGILTVRMNRPQVRNAVNGVMHEELSVVFGDIARDGQTRVVVLRGAEAGGAFCAGGDLDWLEGEARTTAGYREIFWQGLEIVQSLTRMPQPVIALVDGPAIGLGATLALVSDITIMSQDARIGDPHVGVGVVAGDGGAALWPLLIGPNRAKELLMTGDVLGAAEAERIGLVNHVYPAETVEEHVYTLARRLAGGPQLAIEFTKHSVNLFVNQVLNAVMTGSLALEGLTFRTADHEAAVERFQSRGSADVTSAAPANDGVGR